MNEAYSEYLHESLTTMQHHTDKICLYLIGYSTTWTVQFSQPQYTC